MSIPIHHIDKRKRVHGRRILKKKYQPYPHPDRVKYFLDHAIYVIGILAPVVGSSQAIKIWTEQTAEGVSIIMFGFNLITDVVLLAYGIVHKTTPIVIMYVLWLIVNMSIVAGIFMYG
jgi:uncharacterized protein with PQ loop repeat